jgi:hypothetical protein
LEALEPRTLLASDAASLPESLAAAASGQSDDNQKFISQAYHDLLGRAPDPGGLAYWVAQLAAGAPQGQIANDLTHSAEYFSTIINPAYQNYLGRTADSTGLNYWISQMQSGLTDEQLEAKFIGSSEFYAHAGGTDVQWVDAMYTDLLGRPPDPQGQAFWVSQLAAGVSRATVAYGFAASLEREQQRVEADYLHYLNRPADQQGLNYWVQQFANGLTNEDLIGGLVGSTEYYARAANSSITITAHLKNDTGVSNTDGITSDPTIVGQVTDTTAITSFEAVEYRKASGSGGETPQYIILSTYDLTADLAADGSFTLGPTQLAGIFSALQASSAGGALSDGSHTLSLEAGDAAGNVSSIVDVSFTLDTQAPTITVTSPADNTTTGTNLTVVGQASDATSGVAQLQAAVDNVTFAPVTVDSSGKFTFTTQLPLDGTADGPHVVHFQAADVAGNVSPVTDLHFILATAEPAINISSPPAALLTNQDPTIVGQVSGVASPSGTLTAAVDGGAAATVSLNANEQFSLPLTLPLDGTADGPHTVHFRFTTASGPSSTDDYSFALDTRPPAISISSPAAGLITNKNVTVGGHVTDATSGVASLEARSIAALSHRLRSTAPATSALPPAWRSTARPTARTPSTSKPRTRPAIPPARPT